MYTETEITGVDPNNKKKVVVNLNTCDRLTCWQSKEKGVLVFLSLVEEAGTVT